jgi:hypothetical protein
MQKGMFKFSYYFLFAVLPLALLLSCAQKQDVAGKWQETGTKSTIELHRDGTFKAVDDMGMAVNGKYTLQENGTIRFEILHSGNSPEIINGKLAVRGDELTFTSADDKKVETYKRVP